MIIIYLLPVVYTYLYNNIIIPTCPSDRATQRFYNWIPVLAAAARLRGPRAARLVSNINRRDARIPRINYAYEYYAGCLPEIRASDVQRYYRGTRNINMIL